MSSNNRNLFSKMIDFIKNPDYRFLVLERRGYYNWLSDEEFIRRKFHEKMGYYPNLDDPQTFNEKLQWLKLHDRKPEYTRMVDKYEVKKYVADIIGEEYIIPTLGVWDQFEDIDFSQLPNQFVLKCTHDSGGIVICKDQRKFDMQAAKTKIKKCLKRNYYYVHREWPYKDVKPRIIAEPYMEDSVKRELLDYKFFVFNGIAKLLFIATDRQAKGKETKFDFFDINFDHLPFTNGHPNAAVIPEKPSKFAEMVLLAEKLGKDIPHVRVDFYEANNNIYFGELTFSHWSGFVPFDPEEWDKTLGSWIQLPTP